MGSPPSPILILIYKLICVPLILKQFRQLIRNSSEKLTIVFPALNKSFKFGKTDQNGKNEAVELRIENPIDFCWKMFLDRKLGLAESYLAGDWNASPGPKDLLTLLIRARGGLFVILRIAIFYYNRVDSIYIIRPRLISPNQK